jgi:hypothetical protein
VTCSPGVPASFNFAMSSQLKPFSSLMDRQQKIDFVRGIWEAFAQGEMKKVFAVQFFGNGELCYSAHSNK